MLSLFLPRGGRARQLTHSCEALGVVEPLVGGTQDVFFCWQTIREQRTQQSVTVNRAARITRTACRAALRRRARPCRGLRTRGLAAAACGASAARHGLRRHRVHDSEPGALRFPDSDPADWRHRTTHGYRGAGSICAAADTAQYVRGHHRRRSSSLRIRHRDGKHRRALYHFARRNSFGRDDAAALTRNVPISDLFHDTHPHAAAGLFPQALIEHEGEDQDGERK